MEFEMQTSGSDMTVQDNARWERNCRMAKEVATVLVAVAGIIGIAVEYANEKRSDVLWQQKWKVCFMSEKPLGMDWVQR